MGGWGGGSRSVNLFFFGYVCERRGKQWSRRVRWPFWLGRESRRLMRQVKMSGSTETQPCPVRVPVRGCVGGKLERQGPALTAGGRALVRRIQRHFALLAYTW